MKEKYESQVLNQDLVKGLVTVNYKGGQVKKVQILQYEGKV